MVKKRNIWVSPRQDGRWQVKREGTDRASRVVDRKSDAENIARDIGKRDKVEVITQGRDGKIQSKDSFGQDPFPPRDTEH
jgi:hypothetical protein